MKSTTIGLKFLVNSALIGTIQAFTPTLQTLPQSTLRNSSSRLHVHRHLLSITSNGEEKLDPTTTTSHNRREWIKRIAATASTIPFLHPHPSLAETATLAPPKYSSALCDPSVSTLTKKDRTVHILGTAHVSTESAQLAGKLVREVLPKAVFLELDEKRVGRAGSTPETDAKTGGFVSSGGSSSDDSVLMPISERSAAPAPTTTKRNNPFDLKEKVLQASSQLVGNGIKSLYKKLESDGFSAGEEFSTAAQEGISIGSTIVLGDQDVDVTLRRLTEALSRTDIKKLLVADSEIEERLQSLLPPGAGSQLASGPDGVRETGEMSKEQFTSFIETIKAKDNVKLLMDNLKAVAPEIYGAMIGERDSYMAGGLNRMNQFETTVAVMGMAHVDGVERNLKEDGWVVVKSACPVRK